MAAATSAFCASICSPIVERTASASEASRKADWIAFSYCATRIACSARALSRFAWLLPKTLTEVASALADIPAGVPSETLLQRPDVIQAERLLRAANASIGAARAAFFPRITLTASGGVASNSISNLFDSGNGTWLFMPQIVLPIFNAGSNQANLDSARAEQAIRIASYEKAIQTAFREASDALAVRATISEQIAAQTALATAAKESYRLTDLRYQKGIDSYQPVLDALRTRISAQQSLITTQLARQSNAVNLYKVFGGGWQERTAQ